MGPTPLLYHSITDKRDYIIFTPSSFDYSNIFLYDLREDIFIRIGEYESGICISCHSHTLDPINEHLYIYGGKEALYGIFDLKRKKWKKLHNSSSIENFDFAVSCFVKNKKNKNGQIHAFGERNYLTQYLKIKIDRKISLRKKRIAYKLPSASFLFFCHHLNKVFIVGGGNKSIHYLDLNKTKQSRWSKLRIATKSFTDCKYFTAFNGSLLIAIDTGSQRLMALDLKYAQNQKYEWKDTNIEWRILDKMKDAEII